MRDVTSITTSSLGNLPQEPQGIGDDASARLRLAQALQTSLETRELIALLFRHIQPLIAVNGIDYRPRGAKTQEYRVGRKASHSCHYRLNLPQQYLGEITFYRKERFTEAEQLGLETLLASLVYALRNAALYEQALAKALTDPLTGVGNRAALDAAIRREYELLRRSRNTFALLMIDIDNFKSVNDRYGHSSGDRVLCAVADTIIDICRASDMVFRYGGEEFAVLLTEASASGGLVTAQRLRRGIASLAIADGDHVITPTVSIGVSACCQAEESVDALFDRADRALYQAKAKGRDTVCCTPPSLSAAP